MPASVGECNGKCCSRGAVRRLDTPGPHHRVPTVCASIRDDRCRVDTAIVRERVQDTVACQNNNEQRNWQNRFWDRCVVADVAGDCDDEDGEDGSRVIKKLALGDCAVSDTELVIYSSFYAAVNTYVKPRLAMTVGW